MRKASSNLSRLGSIMKTFSLWGLLLAVAFAPMQGKTPLGPIPLSITDFAMLFACVTGLISRRMNRNEMLTLPLMEAFLPFLLLLVPSCINAESLLLSGKEIVKIVAYIVCGSILATAALDDSKWRSRIKTAVYIGFFCGVTLACLNAWTNIEIIEHISGGARPVQCCTVLLGGSALLMGWKSTSKAKCLLLLLPFGLLLIPIRPEFIPDASTPVSTPTPQRYIEAYAAMSVVADRPLLGVGPGNYQMKIGEYYRGLPKDNTMPHGSQIGWAVLLATTGLLGLAAFLYWAYCLFSVASFPMKCGVSVFLLIGFMTPPLAGPILLPWILIHSMAARNAKKTFFAP
jgi:hypothetical protein